VKPPGKLTGTEGWTILVAGAWCEPNWISLNSLMLCELAGRRAAGLGIVITDAGAAAAAAAAAAGAAAVAGEDEAVAAEESVEVAAAAAAVVLSEDDWVGEAAPLDFQSDCALARVADDKIPHKQYTSESGEG
jgi:hypothetical protein